MFKVKSSFVGLTFKKCIKLEGGSSLHNEEKTINSKIKDFFYNIVCETDSGSAWSPQLNLTSRTFFIMFVGQKYAEQIYIFDRPGVAASVLKTPPLLID